MTYVAGIDVGGTFTDVTLLDTDSGHTWAAKSLSTPEDQSAGFLDALQKAAGRAGVSLDAINRCFHGTTVATNAILQRAETRLGLITTEGFKYVLEVGRHDIPRAENYFGWIKPARPVAPESIREVRERTDYHGRIVEPLDEAQAREAVRALKAQDVESIAVSLLYSFLNPAHEQRIREIIQEEHPEAFVSLSSDVLPRFREYERTMTTVLNAYVAPHVSRYLTRLDRRLQDAGSPATLLIMKSNGGVVSAESAARQAIHTAISGPAAGVIGAVALAREAGFADIISIDVGGTSADVCLSRGGQSEITVEGKVGGLPMELPMLDVHTIGAGGGSIAWLTGTGSPAVGPRSAGAAPGPVCYARGGMEPTVTDAQIVLGRLPAYLLGGEIPLDVEAARRAITDRFAKPLGLDLLDAAEGILAIVNNNMVGAIRAVSIARGLDPRDYALVAFGGAGPLHAGALAETLGIGTVLIPPRPGVLSTEGLLRTDLRNDYVQTCSHVPITDLDTLSAILHELEARAQTELDREQIPAEQRILARAADLRYEHQGSELSVEVPDGPLTAETLATAVDAFHREHARLYTYDLRDLPVELVNLRVTATGRLAGAGKPPAATSPRTAAAAPAAKREIYFGAAHGWLGTPCLTREALVAGTRLAGPLAIDQDDTTVVLWPGQSASVDATGNLIVAVAPA